MVNLSQCLKTNEPIGSVIADIDNASDKHVTKDLKAIEHTLSLFFSVTIRYVGQEIQCCKIFRRNTEIFL